MSNFLFYSSLPTAKNVDLVGAPDDFPCMHNGNRPYFHSGYLDYSGAFD